MAASAVAFHDLARGRFESLEVDRSARLDEEECDQGELRVQRRLRIPALEGVGSAVRDRAGHDRGSRSPDYHDPKPPGAAR